MGYFCKYLDFACPFPRSGQGGRGCPTEQRRRNQRAAFSRVLVVAGVFLLQPGTSALAIIELF